MTGVKDAVMELLNMVLSHMEKAAHHREKLLDLTSELGAICTAQQARIEALERRVRKLEDSE